MSALTEDLRLLDPILTFDTALEAQHLADSRHVRALPLCDMAIVRHAEFGQSGDHSRINAANVPKIIHWRRRGRGF